MAATAAQHGIGLTAQGATGIGSGQQQPHLLAHSQVVEVIAEVEETTGDE